METQVREINPETWQREHNYNNYFDYSYLSVIDIVDLRSPYQRSSASYQQQNDSLNVEKTKFNFFWINILPG